MNVTDALSPLRQRVQLTAPSISHDLLKHAGTPPALTVKYCAEDLVFNPRIHRGYAPGPVHLSL